MRKRSLIKFIAISAICVFSVYLSYRVYYVWQLNMRLEKFMAQQVKGVQDKFYDEQWFKDRQITKPSDYAITRIEAYYIYGNRFFNTKEGYYISRWISDNEGVRRITKDEPIKEHPTNSDGNMVWVYSIRPLSGSTVCIMLESHKPNNWTAGGMGSVAGSSEFIIDTSKSNWELEQIDSSTSSCNFFRDTELLRTLLVYVH